MIGNYGQMSNKKISPKGHSPRLNLHYAPLYIYFACLSFRLVFYPINVKTAEPIGPKFCLGRGTHMTLGKV